jgi:hypothetical protein
MYIHTPTAVAVAASGDCLGAKEKIGNVEGKLVYFTHLTQKKSFIFFQASPSPNLHIIPPVPSKFRNK